MSGVRSATIYKLASAAQEAELEVMRGKLTRDQDGHWKIGSQNLEQWLSSHDGQELVVVLGSLDDERPVIVRTCRTCGRDFQDLDCPYCRANRLRLRGRG